VTLLEIASSLHDLTPDARSGAEVQEALRFLATMDQSARRMGHMVDGLLALARASRAPLQWQAVPLAPALAQAQATLAASAKEGAGPAVEWRIAAGLPAVHADAALLQEVLVQLLGNAVKFSGKTGRPIRIAVQAADPVVPAGDATVAPGNAGEAAAAPLVAFTISDNGAGFDNSRASALFGVFQRLHRETEFEGVGTGLAVCRAIVQRHGGTITATGVAGGGCTVHVQWPGVPGPGA
jgi:signal transduction histidine kinase